MRVLLTAFDPFGKDKINPALEALKLVKEKDEEIEIVKLEVKTIFKEGARSIFKKIEEVNPDIVLSIGQAGGRSDISLEFVGINYLDARIPDNAGNQPIGEKIFQDGENAYFSNLDVRRIVAYLNKNEIPAHVSYSAGTFVCNEILYSILYYRAKKNKSYRAGFMHVPFIPSQVLDKPNLPSMSIDMLVKAIEKTIEIEAHPNLTCDNDQLEAKSFGEVN